MAVVKMILVGLALIVCAVLVGLFVITQSKVSATRAAYPAIGSFVSVNGAKVHYVDVPADNASAQVVVFLHGASGNLRDPLSVYRDRLKGQVRQIFLDRPGHGWSERGAGDMSAPAAQAKHVRDFLSALDIDKAVLVAHSWSGSVAAAFGVLFPDRVSGIVMSAPVSHEWPGGVQWFYHASSMPIIGSIFNHTIAVPAGHSRVMAATENVFAPNPIPDYYEGVVGPTMVLVPSRFAANSEDVANLKPRIIEMSKRYDEITAPMIIITGDQDGIVYSWIHSEGLDRDVPNSRLITLENTGHMPHHVKPDVFVDAILEIANLKTPGTFATE
ncbi:MAG: alpha/beta hydrolase [Pseudomonadota bacterium]